MGLLCDFKQHLEIDLLRSGVKQGTRDTIDSDTDATGTRLSAVTSALHPRKSSDGLKYRPPFE
jgi:hypothetical protein